MMYLFLNKIRYFVFGVLIVISACNKPDVDANSISIQADDEIYGPSDSIVLSCIASKLMIYNSFAVRGHFSGSFLKLFSKDGSCYEVYTDNRIRTNDSIAIDLFTFDEIENYFNKSKFILDNNKCLQELESLFDAYMRCRFNLPKRKIPSTMEFIESAELLQNELTLDIPNDYQLLCIARYKFEHETILIYSFKPTIKLSNSESSAFITKILYMYNTGYIIL